MLSYKTQTYCHMHLIRFIYRNGGDVRCLKNLIAPPSDSLGSHRSEWSLHFVGLLIHGSASMDSSVSSTTYPLAPSSTLLPPHFGSFTRNMVFLTLELCYLGKEILIPQSRWCGHWWAQFTVVSSPFFFLLPPGSATSVLLSRSLPASFKVTDVCFILKVPQLTYSQVLVWLPTHLHNLEWITQTCCASISSSLKWDNNSMYPQYS